MIIEPTQQNVTSSEGVNFIQNSLTHAFDFWALGYLPGTIEILLICEEEQPITGGQTVTSKLEGFGATSYQELITEAQNRGLIMPLKLL